MDIKSDFGNYDSNPNLAYFDSTSTTLVPKPSVNTTATFLNSVTVSSRRGAHRLAVRGGNVVETTRQTLARFIETEPASVSFQNSIPSAVASLLYGYDWKRNKKNKVIISQSEDNSIYMAILRAAEILHLDIEIIPVLNDGSVSVNLLDSIIDEKTGIVAVCYVVPGIGTKNPVSEVAEITHSYDAILLTDTTRSMGVTKDSPVHLGADVLVFSANIGLMGPPGLAIQWINPLIDRKHIPGILGGSSVSNVSGRKYEVAFQPDKYESGCLNVPAIAGLETSINYLSTLFSKGLIKHLTHLSIYMRKRLQEIDSLTLYGTSKDEATIFGFNLGEASEIGCHDIALFLDESNIAVRSGLICAHSLIQSMTQGGLIQASIHGYNTIDDINHLVSTLDAISKQLL